MKGFVKVDRCDVLSAIIGFGMKNDFAKDARKKGIIAYYEKNYVNGGWFHKFWYKGLTPNQYIYKKTGAWFIYAHHLKDFLNEDELDLVNWLNSTSSHLIEPLKSLYNASVLRDDSILIDNEMAAVLTEYKTYLEETK